MQYDELIQHFKARFGPGSVRIFAGPARVNLIGEHTDYNGGYVFPCALEMRSACVARQRSDGKIRIASTSHPDFVEADIDHLEDYRQLPWGNYQLGVIYIMKQAGYHITGYDLLFDETVPHGSGLSSSAAIEMAMAMAVASFDRQTTNRTIQKTDLACIAQRAENEYVGMNCGIMDQFASAMGKKGHAILLQCSSLDYQYVPFDTGKKGYGIVIASTNKPRKLISSKYNERREECGRALADIQKVAPRVACLCDLTIEEFELFKDAIKDETCRKRAEHVVYENMRTKRSVALLVADDFNAFGQLMCDSHDSLRELYEVTGKELDALYESALEAKGVIGSRMTGAGFGGCTVSIVKTEMVEDFKETVARAYYKRTGLAPGFYCSDAADGAREIFI